MVEMRERHAEALYTGTDYGHWASELLEMACMWLD
jgi:hypothetical protein